MKHLLLIEDDPWLAELYSDVLSELSDSHVHHASTAKKAFELLNQHAIDIIILDMFLPDHNGVEFLHEVASYDDSQKIPIIILSAVNEHDFGMSDERWRQYGVVQYLYKPTTKPAQLATAVKQHLLATHLVQG